MKSLDKPLLLWVGLWIIGEIIVGFRNDLTHMGRLSSLQDTVIGSLYIDIVLIPIALVAWFIMKIALKKIKKEYLLSNKNATKNVLLVWLVIFGLIFLRGILK